MFKKIKNFMFQAALFVGVGAVVWTTVLDEATKDQLRETANEVVYKAKAVAMKAAEMAGLAPEYEEGELARNRTEMEWEKLGL